MAQFNTFLIPLDDDGTSQEAMNRFLRGHRVLQTEHFLTERGWAFCVEWIEGRVEEPVSGGLIPKGKVDYMEILPPAEFARFTEYRDRRSCFSSFR